MSFRRAATGVLGVAFVVAVLVMVGTAFAAGPSQTKTERFLIISPHTPEMCLKALDEVQAKSPKLLTKMDWGCMAGDHTGYVEVNATDEAAAREMLPDSARATAKIIKLNKFTADQIKQFHAKM
jgi:hypothetical protein